MESRWRAGDHEGIEKMSAHGAHPRVVRKPKFAQWRIAVRRISHVDATGAAQ